MSESGKWTARKSKTGSTELIQLYENGEPMAFSALFNLLQNDLDFAAWYSDVLANSSFSAFFWEHPPLTTSSIETATEFVLVDAPMLARLRPDAKPFRSYFGRKLVVTFRNLSGDATLVAPSTAGSTDGYAHMATFLKAAPTTQINEMWKSVGQAVSASLSDRPIWLSTSGLGVAWLHIRLDSTPKYYQHQPYKSSPVAALPTGL